MKQKTEDILTGVTIAVCVVFLVVLIMGATIGLWGNGA